MFHSPTYFLLYRFLEQVYLIKTIFLHPLLGRYYKYWYRYRAGAHRCACKASRNTGHRTIHDIHPVSSTYACPRSLTADATEEEQSVANHRKCRGAGQSGGGGDDVSVPPPELCVQGHQQQQHRAQEKGQNQHGGGGFVSSSVTIKSFTMN